MIELDIWAIIWPILKEVWEMMGLDQKAISVAVFLLASLVSAKILNLLKPEYKRGSVVSEALQILWGTVTFLLPFYFLGYWLSSEYPLLSETFSFIANEFDLGERIFAWVEIFLLAVLLVAFQRYVIHKISILLQKVFMEIPFLGDILIVSILVLEGILFLASAWTLPISMIVLAKDRGVLIPITMSNPTVKPSEDVASDTVWEAITTGVGRAQANGVTCDPYLILAIKQYETGSNLCDASMSESQSCISSAGCLGMMQFSLETCQRNATRRGVTCDVWDPARSVEVACYAIADEMKFSLEQSKSEFISEFSSEGFVWNADPTGAGTIYDRALAFQQSAMDSLPNDEQESVHSGEYLWPGPEGSYISYDWGANMSYGKHNGIDIILSGIPTFQVMAVDAGQARYWEGDSCDAGVITLVAKSGEQFHYVHMELDTGKIDIPTDGSWVDVKKGQVLGWVLDGTTSCSDGSHLHLMHTDGTFISDGEFKR